MLGEQTSLLKASWPKYDPELAKEDEIEIPVQVNGKLRSVVVVAAGTSQEEILQRALAEEKIQTYVCRKRNREEDFYRQAGQYCCALAKFTHSVMRSFSPTAEGFRLVFRRHCDSLRRNCLAMDVCGGGLAARRLLFAGLPGQLCPSLRPTVCCWERSSQY